jgi:hypothetical protein
MDPIAPRAISTTEVAAIREAFAVGTMPGISAPVDTTMAFLQVVSRCPCGCASVGFISEAEATSLEIRRLADAEGIAPNGEVVGLIVWGSPSQISSIEVYWAPTDGAPLPVPGSMHRYEAPA